MIIPLTHIDGWQMNEVAHWYDTSQFVRNCNFMLSFLHLPRTGIDGTATIVFPAIPVMGCMAIITNNRGQANLFTTDWAVDILSHVSPRRAGGCRAAWLSDEPMAQLCKASFHRPKTVPTLDLAISVAALHHFA